MSLRKRMLLAPVAMAALSVRGTAQIPVAPTPPAPGFGVASAAPPVPTIWDKLGLSKKAKEECLRKLCATPLGQLLNNGTAPFQAISGGLLPPFCPVTPSAADLEKPGAEGAAAKIKADEANAKARAAAVRYLGTVDCHYWPEAEAALIGALRGDRNECVRNEAAIALAQGCCCTKKTIEALNIVVSCSDRDGAPKENSHRVIAAAQAALDHCLACYNPPPPEPVGPPRPPIEGSGPPVEGGPPRQDSATSQDAEKVTTAHAVVGPADAKQPINPGEVKPGVGQLPRAARPTGFEYYNLIAQQPMAPIVAEARRLSQLHKARTAATPQPEHSVTGMLTSARPRGNSPIDSAGNLRAAAVSPRPANLWDLLHEPTAPPTTAVVMREPPPSPAPAPTVVATREPAIAPPLVPAETREPAPVRREVAAPTAYNPMVMPKLPADPMPAAPKRTEAPVVPAIKMPEPKPAEPRPPVIPASSAMKMEGPMLPPPPTIVNRSPAPATTPAPQSVQLPVIVSGPQTRAMEPAPARTQAPVALKMPVPPPVPAGTTAKVPTPAPAPAKPPVVPPAPTPVKLPDPAPMPAAATVKVPEPPAAPVRPTAAPATARAMTPEAAQAIAVLTGNTTTQQRRQAADGVMRTDVFTAPDLAKHLLTVAQSATEATETRVARIRALVRGHATAPTVLKGLEGLSDDDTAAARVEAIIGIGRLKTTAPAVKTVSPALR